MLQFLNESKKLFTEQTKKENNNTEILPQKNQKQKNGKK